MDLQLKSNNLFSAVFSKSDRVNVLSFKKEDLKQMNKVYHDELNMTGVYILYGETDKNNIYIGEADNLFKRLSNHPHLKNENIFEVIIAYSNNISHIFTKDDIQNLENKFIKMAMSNPGLEVLNSNKGKTPTLSSDDKYSLNIESEVILERLSLINKDFFNKKYDEIIENVIGKEIDYIGTVDVYCEVGNQKIKGIFNPKNNTLTVLGNQEFKIKNKASQNLGWVDNTLQKMVATKSGDLISWKNDYTFSSSSMAGQLFYGTNVNGWKFWKINDIDYIDKIRKK